MCPISSSDIPRPAGMNRRRDVGGRDQPADVWSPPSARLASASGKPITFQRAVNLDVVFIDSAYSCKGGLPGIELVREEQKDPCCRRVTVTINPPPPVPSNQPTSTHAFHHVPPP